MNLPESSDAVSCTVDDVLITDELARRPTRPPDYAAENEALVALAQELTSDPGGVLQKVAELVLRLCRADSAGISVLERDGGEEIFRWHAAAGRFAPNLRGTMPRSASPCGTVITRNSVLLFDEAERFFPALRGVEPRIYENLLAPWEVGGKVTGTLWAIGHSPERRFDAEDARLLRSLARFAGAAYDLLERTRAYEGLRAERLAALNLMEDAIIARRETEQATAALRESEERLQKAMSIETVGVIFLNAEGVIHHANEAFERMSGYSESEIRLGKVHWDDLTPPEFMEASLRACEELKTKGQSTPYEKQYLRPDTSRWWGLFAGKRLGEGEFVEFVLDVTDRKNAEAALRASEERLRSVVEGVTDYAIITQDLGGRVQTWNPGAEQMFGYTADEMIGRSVEILFTPEDRAAGAHLEEMRTASATGRAADERWHVRKDGTLFYASGVMSPLGDVTPTGYVKIARDLTRQKEAEDALRRAYGELEGHVRDRTMELAEANVILQSEVGERRAAEEQIKQLLRQLVTAQEDERRRIARDIHDHLGQQMTGLRLSLELLRKQCADDPDLYSRIEQTQAVAQKLDEDVDFLAWELRPAALDDLGLTPAFGTFVNDWSKHFGLVAEFHTSGVDGIRLAPDVEINLYRILQEALNNVAKHAQADGVSVLLDRKGDEVVLIVEDDGRGFDPEAKMRAGGRGEGLGLVGMRERAQLAGGSAEIESAAGAGTTVIVRVPFVRAEEGGARG